MRGGRRGRGAHAHANSNMTRSNGSGSSTSLVSSRSRGSSSATKTTQDTSTSVVDATSLNENGTAWVEGSWAEDDWAAPGITWAAPEAATTSTDSTAIPEGMVTCIDLETSETYLIPASTLVSAQPKSKSKPEPYRMRDTLQTTPLYQLLRPGEPVAFDGEWQLYRFHGGKWQQRLGWVSVKNTTKDTIFSAYIAYPNEPGMEKMLPRAPDKDFGLRRPDFYKSNGAVYSQQAEKILKKIFANRPVVVHDARGDTNALYHEKDAFATSTIYDTQQMYYHHQPHGFGPGLATCVSREFGVEMQKDGVHDPGEDAGWTMDLFLKQ